MKKLFMKEVQTELARCVTKHEVFTEDEISRLPVPLQRYFRFCGFIGKEKMMNVKITMDDIEFKRSIDKPGIKMKCEQYNFVSSPTRIAYMDSRMMGIIPFEGRDKYQNGKGAMTGKILRKITLFDETGIEFDISGIITFLAETLIAPSCVLQDYIKWEEIDNNKVKGIIENEGIRAEGIFEFSDKGEFLKFVTDERYMDKGKGIYEKERWTAEVSEYVEKNGIKIPRSMKATWNLPKGDFVYFDGSIADIEYNVK